MSDIQNRYYIDTIISYYLIIIIIIIIMLRLDRLRSSVVPRCQSAFITRSCSSADQH